MKPLAIITFALFPISVFAGNKASESAGNRLTINIRTENYPRPPYSAATYYIYERKGKTICTKLEVCNKFDECKVSYWAGQHKEPEDIRTGQPYGTTSVVPIPQVKLKKHVCLVRFKLVP